MSVLTKDIERMIEPVLRREHVKFIPSAPTVRIGFDLPASPFVGALLISFAAEVSLILGLNLELRRAYFGCVTADFLIHFENEHDLTELWDEISIGDRILTAFERYKVFYVKFFDFDRLAIPEFEDEILFDFTS
jgi:hypothetical protein